MGVAVVCLAAAGGGGCRRMPTEPSPDANGGADAASDGNRSEASEAGYADGGCLGAACDGGTDSSDSGVDSGDGGADSEDLGSDRTNDVASDGQGDAATDSRSDGTADGKPEAGVDAGTTADGGACTNGAIESRECGLCGVQARLCEGAAWQPWADCLGQGTCVPAAAETGACGVTAGACRAGTRSRLCSASCRWGAWGACGGDYVGPSAEVCGDGIDNNCNGAPDEGCACSPVATGQAGSLVVASGVTKLIADPGGCLIYGLIPGSPSSVLVIDGARKSELARVQLSSAAGDFDVSHDGRWIVAAMAGHHALAVVDKATWTAKTVLVAADPERVQVSNAGTAYYVTLDQWSQLHRVDVAAASPPDTTLFASSGYQPDIQLSADETHLYLGESGTTGGELEVYDLRAGTATFATRSTWNGNSGFYNTTRWLYLAPQDHNIYFADHELDPNNLAFMRGLTGQVFAQDRAGTFAISATGPMDARLLRPFAPFPVRASAATLAAGDTEIWWYDGAGKTLHYENVADRIGSRVLGLREQPGRLIGQYQFTRLVADPVRPLLYGLDPGAGVVVSIDRSTREPTGEVVVGSSPTDISVDGGGGYLYIAHAETQAVAQIRLDVFAFAKWFPSFRDGFQIAAAGSNLVITIDTDQYVSTSLINVQTGTRNDFGAGGFEAAIAVTADGRTFFTGSSQISGLARYDLATGQFEQKAMSHRTFASPARSLVITPNGDGVYYGGSFLDGATLDVLRYTMPDTIRTVTSDGRLATSATTVYRVSDGMPLGTLSPGGAVQVASPDARTLFVATATGIAAVDLSGY
jgi:DNA-binding beta-propeller fold protein YncE